MADSTEVRVEDRARGGYSVIVSKPRTRRSRGEAILANRDTEERRYERIPVLFDEKDSASRVAAALVEALRAESIDAELLGDE